MKQLIAILLISLLAFSCKKSEDIGANLLPGDDLLNVVSVDTFSLFTKTVSETPFRTDKMNFNFLGYINDAIFGTSNAKLALQINMPSGIPNDSLGPFTIDSVFLYLKYSSVYGDTTTPVNFTVKKLNVKLNEYLPYYSNESSIVGVQTVGSNSNYYFEPAKAVSSGLNDTAGVSSLLKIPLYTSYANEFVSQIGSSDSVLSKLSVFQDRFVGLMVEAANSANIMAKVDLSSSYSRMIIFVKDRNNTTHALSFPTKFAYIVGNSVTTLSNSINLYNHGLSSTINNAVSSSNESDSIVYISGESSVLTEVKFPTVSNFGIKAINKAVLTFNQYQDNSNGNFKLPALLYLYDNNAYNANLLASATLDSTTINGTQIYQYNFNITSLIQRVSVGNSTINKAYISTKFLAGTDPNYNLASNVGYAPNRVILAGSTTSNLTLKPVLKIIYTPIN
ncbi:MAG: DUF4270 family protein [Chitinophagales bacterium]|nr:DUF4270 family protein [Chitinophagales bacterium]